MTQEKGNLIIPTVADVQAFSHSIGVSEITITPGYEKWWNVLHEIAHFAVKPDGYIERWRQHGRLSVPCNFY